MTHRENITAVLECYFSGFMEEIIDSACNRILEQEPKAGHWRNNGNGDGYIKWHCSECNMLVRNSSKPWYKYCPTCGAKMESEG